MAKGPKAGGRKPGNKNKRTIAREEREAAIGTSAFGRRQILFAA
jgi:hypothetical protein